MPRRLSSRPNLDQLRRQAKELLDAFRANEPAAITEVQSLYRDADPARFALHDAQLVLARAYGFESWPKLKTYVDTVSGAGLIHPAELRSNEGRDTWDTIVAASTGDVEKLQRLLARNPNLSRATYWYAPAIHFAVRAGHADAVRLLLAAGADPESNGLTDRNLIEMARERGHDDIAAHLEQARRDRGRIRKEDAPHPIHQAAATGDTDRVRALLDEDGALVHRGCSRGLSPLHHAVTGGQGTTVDLLIERGANVHARTSGDLEPIDFAIWQSDDGRMAERLIAHGATYDLTIASARGDVAAVGRMLDATPSRIAEVRPSGRRPLSAAAEFDHTAVVALLLARGANPRWDEPDAPQGMAVHFAVQRDNVAILKMLLEHGADPNEDVDSTSSPLVFASAPETRSLLESYGAGHGLFETTPLEEDAELVKQLVADPDANEYRIGAALTMSAGRPDLLGRLLSAGLRMPAVYTACQGYLNNPAALRLLLAHGMNPNQMNWQHQTLLHWAAIQETTECAAILIDAGADLTARDDEYKSTPLAWAARTNRAGMIEYLLSRGAPLCLADDEPWATPLAWAERRGHGEVAAILRMHGATS